MNRTLREKIASACCLYNARFLAADVLFQQAEIELLKRRLNAANDNAMNRQDYSVNKEDKKVRETCLSMSASYPHSKRF